MIWSLFSVPEALILKQIVEFCGESSENVHSSKCEKIWQIFSSIFFGRLKRMIDFLGDLKLYNNWWYHNVSRIVLFKSTRCYHLSFYRISRTSTNFHHFYSWSPNHFFFSTYFSLVYELCDLTKDTFNHVIFFIILLWEFLFFCIFFSFAHQVLH